MWLVAYASEDKETAGGFDSILNDLPIYFGPV
jgi:hypothetical protein